MNLKELFDMQRTLDERIIKQHGLEGQDLLDQRILALNVELAELAQEVRCFKFWSTNQQPSERVLDELVDVLHFVLSVGLTTGAYKNIFDSNTCGNGFNEFMIQASIDPYEDLTYQFNSMFEMVSKFRKSAHEGVQRLDHIRSNENLLSHFVATTRLLGFTWEQVTQAYMEKNKENHDRQDRGY